VEDEHALVAPFGARERAREDLLHVALGVGVLREDDDPPVAPARVLVRAGTGLGGRGDRGAGVRAEPGEERAHLGVGLAAAALGEGAHAPEDARRLLARGRQEARRGGDLGGVLGGERLVVDAVGLRVALGLEKEIRVHGRCLRLDATGLLEGTRVDLERPRERLRAAQETLLEVHEDQVAAALPGSAELGVAREELRELELDVLPAEVAGEGALLLGLSGLGARALLRGAPAVRAVGELDPKEDALGELRDLELAEVALEAPHHHGSERTGVLDGNAAREADGVEDLEEGAEGVRVPVVRRGAQEEAVVELGGEVADGGGGGAVDGVLARRGRRGDVRLVEDEEALLGAVAEVGEERVAVLGAADQRVADDEAVVRRPGVHAEAALDAPAGDELPRHHLEAEAEAAHHLVAPLKADRGGTDDQHEVGLLAEDQLLEDEPRLDRLSEPDIVGDEEVRAGELEGLHEGRELVRHELDAGAERRLEAGGVGGADGAPLERVEVGAEAGRRVEGLGLPEPLGLRSDHASAELEVPEDLELPARRIVIEARELEAGGVRRVLVDDLLDEPLPSASGKDLAGAKQPLAVVGDDFSDGSGGIDAGHRADPPDQLVATGSVRIERVSTTDGAQLIAPQLAQHGREVIVPDANGKEPGGDVLRLASGAQVEAEDASEVVEPLAGELREDGPRGDGGGGHGGVGRGRSWRRGARPVMAAWGAGGPPGTRGAASVEDGGLDRDGCHCSRWNRPVFISVGGGNLIDVGGAGNRQRASRWMSP
jgi:hypothetical protein